MPKKKTKRKTSKKASTRAKKRRTATAKPTAKKKSGPKRSKKSRTTKRTGGKTLEVRPHLLESIPELTAGSMRHPTNKDSLESYLAYFPSFELLTADEEVFFSKMARSGNALGRDRLIMHNIRLVAAEALRYFKGKSSDDTQAVSVISEGLFGLIRAVERFDPDRGYRFSTYATHWIRRFIYRGSNSLRFIRLPHYIHGILARMASTSALLEAQLGREPDSREMADALGQREGAYRLAVQAGSNTNIIRPVVNDDNREVGGVSEDYLDQCNVCQKCVDPADALLATEARELLLKALDAIDDRLAEVVKMRYGVDCERKYTLQEIGEKLNLSRERVRQLEAEGKDHLRVYLNEYGVHQ